MAALPRPVPRCIVVCEEVVPDAENPRQLTLVRVVNYVNPVAGAGYPVVRPELSVFVVLTECRGVGRLRIEIRNADTDAVTLRTPDQPSRAPNNPLGIYGVTFRLRNCVFPEPGLHRVQLLYDDVVLTETPILLRLSNTLPPPRGAKNGR
jgi:hypothetical protein